MSRVSRFLGRFLGGSPGAHQLVLRAYGKLPLYAEYRRLEVAPGVATTFSQWLDEGRLTWVRTRQGGPAGQMRAARLVLHWSGGDQWLIADLWDSRDSLGRVFPFAFFVTCPPDRLGRTWLERWASCAAIHAALEQAYAGLASLGAGGDFYRLCRQQTVNTQPADAARLAEELLAGARRIGLEEWFASTELSRASSGDWFAGVLGRAARWKSGSSPLGELVLGFPLARRLPYDVQAALWLAWVSALTAAASRDPWLILPAVDGPGPARLYLGFRDLLPGDFQLLTGDADAYGYVEDLGEVCGDPEAGSSAAPMAKPTGPLLDALLHGLRG